MSELNMAARLAAIMGDVGRIEKKGKITSKGDGPTYKFARDSDVLEAVNPRLAEAGCILVPEHTELLSMTENMRGTQIIANIKTSWHVTDGKESIRFETLGQGQDSGDKALPKAQSNARKYAFFMLFHIVTGDDPDHYASDQPERERGPARVAPTPSAPAPVRTPEENALIDELMEITGGNYARMELLAKAVGVKSGERATADQLREMIAQASLPLPEAASAHAAPASAPGDGGPPSPVSGAPLTLDDVLEATGGVDVTPPPRPGTPDYRRLPVQERADARVYWAAREREEARA